MIDDDTPPGSEKPEIRAGGQDAGPPRAHPGLTFANVLEAVDRAEGLTAGVRSNLRSAVMKVADLMSKSGPGQTINVHAIAERLGKQSAARLGFKTKGGRSAFESNFWRALRIAGFDTLPGRDTTPLLLAWADLDSKLTEPKVGRPLSQFLHFSSRQGWAPGDIEDAHVHRYREQLGRTCMKSKADKVARNTVRAWNIAMETIPGWPQRRLQAGYKTDRFYILPRPVFPASYHKDVEKFLAPDTTDWLEADEEIVPLKPRTKSNYREGLRRAASILVRLGVAPNSIRSLADVARADRAHAILHFISDRTGRTKGGHVGFMALLLLMVAERHLQAEKNEVEKLFKYFKNSWDQRQVMSEGNQRRLAQFDDPALLEQLERLPEDIVAAVRKRPVNRESANLVRIALLTALLRDTALRSGNVVAIDLDRHLMTGGSAGQIAWHLHIPAAEVKNGVEFRGKLEAETARILQLYVQKYRKFHSGVACSWLFARADGSHWPQTQAYATFKDYADRTIGVDMTLHIFRALAGKIVLDEHPGAAPVVQQMLGHKVLTTTVASYAFLAPAKARELYHGLLRRRRQDGPDMI